MRDDMADLVRASALLALIFCIGWWVDNAFGGAGAPGGGPPDPGGAAPPPEPEPTPKPEPAPELADLALTPTYCQGQVTATVTNSGAPFTGKLELVYLVSPAHGWMGEPVQYYHQGTDSWSLKVVALKLSGFTASAFLQHQFTLDLALLPEWQQAINAQIELLYPGWDDPDPEIFWIFVRVKVVGQAEQQQLFGWAAITNDCEL